MNLHWIWVIPALLFLGWILFWVGVIVFGFVGSLIVLFFQLMTM